MLIDFLHANCDIFMWRPAGMLVILREVAEHSLNIHPTARSVA
jgi:hypothetical protein